jgi:hypothetical protein
MSAGVRNEGIGESKWFMKKVIILAIGVSLVLFTVMAMNNVLGLGDLIDSTVKLDFIRNPLKLLPSIYGISIILCTLLNRKWRLQFSMLLSLLTVIGFAIAYDPMELRPTGFWDAITTTSIIAVPLLLISCFMKKSRTWIYLATAILLFLLIIGWNYATTINIALVANPYDTTERDEALTKMGYTFCGEYLIEPKPGIYRISWNKTFIGNESMACYFVVKLSRGDRPFYAIQNFTVSYEKRSGRFDFYYSKNFLLTLDSAKNPSRENMPFSEYGGPETIEYAAQAPDYQVIFYREDVLVSYKPRIIEGEALMEVRWILEINLLWQV